MSEDNGLVFLEDMSDRQKQPGFFRLYGKLILLLFLVALAGLSFFLITQGALSYRLAGREYDRIRNTHVRVTEVPYEADPEAEGALGKDDPGAALSAGGDGTAESTVRIPVLEIDFDALSAINGDTAAWLYVPVSDISYPVVRAGDRDYYTKHTFEGTYNVNGAIFIEPFNSPAFTDRNTFLYGHNSADGSMFGNLYELGFRDAERERNPYIYVYLKNGEARAYRICAFYVAKEDGESFRTIETESDYDGYVRYITEQAQKDSGTDYTNRPELLTLSTCYGNTGTDERFLVHAVRVK